MNKFFKLLLRNFLFLCSSRLCIFDEEDGQNELSFISVVRSQSYNNVSEKYSNEIKLNIFLFI